MLTYVSTDGQITKETIAKGFFVDFSIFVSMEPFITGSSITCTLNLFITNSSLCFYDYKLCPFGVCVEEF